MAKLATLVDDFSDGVIGPLWNAAGNVVETGGQARLTPSTTGAQLVAASSYDLTNSRITVQFTSFTNAGVGGRVVQCGLGLEVNPSNGFGMRKVDNELVVTKTINNVETNSYFVWNGAATWWRIIQVDSNTLQFQTSTNGTGWSIVNSVAINTFGLPLTSLQPYFFAVYEGVQPSPGLLAITAVNPGLSMTASGASTSSGTATIRRVNRITASGASSSSGSATLNVSAPTAYTITASGESTSSGTAFIFRVGATNNITASGGSTSSGSAALTVISGGLTAFGQSFSNGSAVINILSPVTPVYTYIFEPPVVYDNPPFLPTTKGWQLIHSRWKNSQPRGRSVLKLTQGRAGLFPESNLYPEGDLYPDVGSESATYITVDTPTIDQMAAAVFTYQGGHIYEVTEVEARQLVNAGFSVRSAPTIPEAPPITPTPPEVTIVVPSPETLPSPTLLL